MPVQYVDYTLWQRAQLGHIDDPESRIAAQLAYWEQALAGMPEQLQLPTDRPYPPVADYRGASVELEWSAELQQQVARIARQHDATSFMVVQAALAVLLSKLSASNDVAVGFAIAGRVDPALDALVGFFVNTLVLRVDVSGDPTVAELLEEVRRRSLAAYEHQDAPFEVLVERLTTTRSLTHSPLVQVLLAWQNFAGQDSNPAGLALGDLQVTPMPAETRTARTDLTFSMAERWSEDGEPAGISGAVEFRTDVFDAASIVALIERLERVLVAMTAEPHRRLSSVDVLNEAEHIRLAELGNQAVLTRPAGAASIPVVFAEQVARTPEAVALSDGHRTWTYRELDEAANRLAHLLAVHGVGPGAVCGAAVGALGRGHHGNPGGAENRGGICADRPGAADGADRLHGRRRRADRRDHDHRTGRSAGRDPTCWSSMHKTPASQPIHAPLCRRRLPMTSPTSSTPRVPPGSRRGWRSLTAT